MFDGIELLATHRSRLAPVIGSNGNRLIVETTKGVKRIFFRFIANLRAYYAAPIYEGNCSIYLFSGKGELLATSESRGLQILTENEYLKLQGFERSGR